VQGTDPDSAGPMPANAQEGIAMKTGRIITAAGQAAVAATPTVASCPDVLHSENTAEVTAAAVAAAGHDSLAWFRA
jgi:hypothetical protein